MKITLAFMVYRPGKRWAEALYSWLFHLSGKYKYEVICAFDDPEDLHQTQDRAKRVMSQFRWADYKPLQTGDVNELLANNLMLAAAAPDSDLFVVLQDDNFCRDMGWDALLVDAMQRAEEMTGKSIGAVSLLAGLKFTEDAEIQRVEVDRPTKPAEFKPGRFPEILDPNLPLKVYSVDGVNRPLAIFTPLMRKMGGFDEMYAPRDWDCTDLGVRLLRAGYQNLYVPLDVENWCVKQTTQTPKEMAKYHDKNKPKFMKRHGEWFASEFETTFAPLFDFEVDA